MASGATEGRQAWVVVPQGDAGGGVLRAVSESGVFDRVADCTHDEAVDASPPREAKRGVTFVVCEEDAHDDALRSIADALREAPVVAVGLGRDRHWIAKAVGRGAHACVVCDGSADADGLVCAAEQAFGIAAHRRGSRRMVDELHASVGELSRRIDHLSSELARLEVMAWTDSLTGLANRRQLEQRLPQFFADAARYDRDISCMMIDLDGFKQVNDELGHGAGDELLRLAARVIVEETRASDLCARFGGDEFVVVMPETTATMAGMVADRLMFAFEEAARACIRSIDGGGEACLARCTMSIGVACLSSSKPKDASELLSHADSALYAAKRGGKRAVMIKTAGGGSVGLSA
ncbi:MAG: GGDEF domain-containing protein [Planctomycetota bacterium]